MDLQWFYLCQWRKNRKQREQKEKSNTDDKSKK